MINSVHASHAYLSAVFAASATAALTFCVQFGLQWEMALVIMEFGSLFALGAGLLPYVLGIRFANRHQEFTWGYFMCGAVITALIAMVPLYALIWPGAECEEGPAVPLLGHAFLLALHFAASGAAAGTACWWWLLRQACFETSVRMS